MRKTSSVQSVCVICMIFLIESRAEAFLKARALHMTYHFQPSISSLPVRQGRVVSGVAISIGLHIAS